MKNTQARQARFSLFRRNLNNDMYSPKLVRKTKSVQKIDTVDYAKLSDNRIDQDMIATKRYYLGMSWIPRLMRFVNFHPLGIKSLISDNNVVNMENLPSFWLLLSVIFKPLCIVVLFAYFFVTIYVNGITQAYVSLDKTSGKCTEIPQAISGIYRADSRGNWETSSNFQYQLHNFFVDMKGLLYTPDKWKNIMATIEKKIEVMGKRTLYRDYSFNAVALGSYAALYNSKESGLGLSADQGSLYFYSAAEPSIIFSGVPYTSIWISRNGTCNPTRNPTTLTYDRVTSTMSINTVLDSTDNMNCEGILYKKLLSASPKEDEEDIQQLDLEVDMNSLSTALAINMGIRSIKHLVNVPGDPDRVQLLQNMLRFRSIDEETIGATSSYLDDLLSPMDPIYCTTFTGLTKVGGPSGAATQCLLRIGNALAYPILNHYGYYDDTEGKMKKCTAASAASTASFAKYLCNTNDLMITLVMYGSDVSATDYSKTKEPTMRPTAAANNPTDRPTTSPTPRPTRFTKRPSYEPTLMPSRSSLVDDDNAYSSPFFDPYAVVDDDINYNNYYYYYNDDDATHEEGGRDSRGPRDGNDDYQRGIIDDDIVSHYFHFGQVIDPGKIFNLLRRAAEEFYNNTDGQGDIYMPKKWWDFQSFAISTAEAGLAPAESLFGNNSFAGLCDPAEDCTTFTFNLYAGTSKKINRYLYTPSNTIAFTDVFYNKQVKRNFGKLYTPPVSLVQFYYSCVMTPADSIFNALGVAKGNADLFVGAGLYLLLYGILVWINVFRGRRPPIPPISHSFANWEIEAIIKEALAKAEAAKLAEQQEKDNALSETERHSAKEEVELYSLKEEPAGADEGVAASKSGWKIAAAR